MLESLSEKEYQLPNKDAEKADRAIETLGREIGKLSRGSGITDRATGNIRMIRNIACILTSGALSASVLLSGCGIPAGTDPDNLQSGKAPASSSGSAESITYGTLGAEDTETEEETLPEHPYEAPELHVNTFHEDLAEGEDGCLIDLSTAPEGYIGVSAVSDARMKLMVLHGEDKYVYDMPSDGTVSFFPLQMGDGAYSIKFKENTTDSEYMTKYLAEADVTLQDEFTTYLYPNDYVNFNADSECVKLADELAAKSADENQLIGRIYDYVAANISYDNAKAEEKSKEKGYVPDPDTTLSEGSGICGDYAALTAAMLRSQGIPCKVIYGYVSLDEQDVYHAWNMFYTQENGWVTAEFSAKGQDWNRLDLTFTATGADEAFIGDGNNYMDSKYY